MRAIFAARAALAAFATAPASAQQESSYPYERLPLQVAGIAPPAGWRTAHLALQGAVAELGELTPDADIRRWRDLMAYLTVAASTGQRVDDMDATLAEVATNCVASASFTFRPASAPTNEAWGQIVCLDRPGGRHALPEAPLQIYVFRSLATADASFRFWRAWRGAPSEAAAMLRSAGLQGAERLSGSPGSADLGAAFAPVMQALTERWGAQLTQALEVCDLAGAPCASLNRSLADVSAYEVLAAQERNLAGVAYVAGDRSDLAGAAEMYRRLFGGEPPSHDISFVLSLRPDNHRFDRIEGVQRLAGMMYAGARAGGGLFGVGDDGAAAPRAGSGRMRAYLLKIARLSASVANGPSYDSFRFDLWPER